MGYFSYIVDFYIIYKNTIFLNLYLCQILQKQLQLTFKTLQQTILNINLTNYKNIQQIHIKKTFNNCFNPTENYMNLLYLRLYNNNINNNNYNHDNKINLKYINLIKKL